MPNTAIKLVTTEEKSIQTPIEPDDQGARARAALINAEQFLTKAEFEEFKHDLNKIVEQGNLELLDRIANATKKDELIYEDAFDLINDPEVLDG